MPCRNPWKSQADSIPAKTAKILPPTQTNYTRPRFCKPCTACAVSRDFVRLGVIASVSVKCKSTPVNSASDGRFQIAGIGNPAYSPWFPGRAASRYNHFRDLTKMIWYSKFTGFTWHHSPNNRPEDTCPPACFTPLQRAHFSSKTTQIYCTISVPNA